MREVGGVSEIDLPIPLKLDTSVRGVGKRGGWSNTHTSMGITTYLLIRNRHFGIERRRLWGMRVGRVGVSEGN